MALAGRTQLHRPLARTQRSVRPACIRRAQPVSRRVIATKALFSFLQPKAQQAAKNPRAEELTSDLIDICSRGTPSAADVEELVAELSRYSTPNPLRSPLLWGTYDVLYCSKPTAVGGPLKKGPGPAVFPGQKARQTLEEPNLLINEVEFKTLGFLPGRSRQVGTIQPLSGDTFQLNITEGELNTGLGAQRKEFAINRKIQIAYLDDTLRIARFLPDDSLEDSEADQEAAQRESEPILFVFKRVVEEVAEEAAAVEEDEDEEEQPRAKSPLAGLFGGTTRTTASLATQAERQIRQQIRAEGTGVTSGTGPSSKQQGGTRRMPSFGRRVQQEEEEVEDPREARRRAQEEAKAQRAAEVEARRREEDKARAVEEKKRAVEEERARKAAEVEAKARAAAEAKERAEQERAERAERAAAIKELLAELTDEARGAAAATKEAAGELREVQRDNGAVLKQVAAAEAAIAEADEDVAQVTAALEEALAARAVAERELKEAAGRLREAQGAYKQQADAAFARRR